MRPIEREDELLDSLKESTYYYPSWRSIVQKEMEKHLIDGQR
jgi:hypothetical protein